MHFEVQKKNMCWFEKN